MLRRGGRCSDPDQTSTQFAQVPGTRNPDAVTLLEEDKIMAYYGGGVLYATAARQEPLL